MLIIDEMGKNISGAGFDPSITGRNRRAVQWVLEPLIKKIVVLGLTRRVDGQRRPASARPTSSPCVVWRDFDVASTYANIITSANLDGAAIPMVMNYRPRGHLLLAVKTVVRVKPQDCRIVRVKNTLHLSEIQFRAHCWQLVRRHPGASSRRPIPPLCVLMPTARWHLSYAHLTPEAA